MAYLRRAAMHDTKEDFRALARLDTDDRELATSNRDDEDWCDTCCMQTYRHSVDEQPQR